MQLQTDRFPAASAFFVGLEDNMTEGFIDLAHIDRNSYTLRKYTGTHDNENRRDTIREGKFW